MLITEQCGFVDRRIETFDPETLLEVIRDGRFDHRLLEGGSFEVRSAPGQGTVVRASWPLSMRVQL